MRKCLYGWVNGSYNFKTKLSGRQIEELSNRLIACNLTRPSEFHRKIRNLKSLKFWKGTEYRTFLLYIGPVLLKDFLSKDVYEHFLILFCAVVILSCNYFSKYIPLADQLLKDYIVHYIRIYGIDSISSNVHNLCHVVKDVQMFGSLSDISAYPFEIFLGKIKNLIRSGNKPLAQIARRTIELSKLQSKNVFKKKNSPYLLNQEFQNNIKLATCEARVFNTLVINESFKLSNDVKNQWFLTKSDSIVSMINGRYCRGQIFILGAPVITLTDFFKLPIKSSFLHVYCSDKKLGNVKLFALKDIKCKLYCIQYHTSFIFIPILHTLDIHVGD